MQEKLTLEEACKKYEPIVHKFAGQARQNTVCSYDDLVQEGRMAIVTAYRTHDPSKSSLTTWTYIIVRDAIREYQKQHLPALSGGAHLYSLMKKVGDNPTVEDITALGVRKDTAIALKNAKESYSSADFDELSGIIGQDDAYDQETESFQWKQHLNDEEIFIVERYFGFNCPQMNMGEIGEEMGRSRKSVGYALNKALVKLRKTANIEDFAP